MTRLELDPFLTELTKLTVRAQQQKAGSVQINFKRYAPHEAAEQRVAAAATTQSKSQKSSKQSKSSQSSTQSKAAKASPSSLAEVHPDDEPALLVHARLGDSKISTVVHSNQANKFNRDLKAILTAKVTDNLIDSKVTNSSALIGAGSREQKAKRKLAIETRDGLIKDGKASHGQVKRAKNNSSGKVTETEQTQ